MGFLGRLIALGHWSDDDLLALLKEAVPGMGVLRQMMLIWGLRDEGERSLGMARCECLSSGAHRGTHTLSPH